MTKKLILLLLVGLLVVGLGMVGCAPTEDEPDEPDETDEVDEPEPLPELGTGALFDEVIFTVVDSHAAAVRQLQAGDLDFFGFPITDPDLYDEILADPDLTYAVNYGGYREIRFNTAGPVFDNGVLNPFRVAAIREAFNWLLDRDYMVDEHLGGLGQPKYSLLGTAFPDYTVRYPHIAMAIEDHYAHDPDKAAAVITEEMEKLGAELVDGIWHYEGDELEVKFLIRSDLPPFPAAGDYVADLLEEMGFKIERMYRTGADAAPIWIGSNPAEGQWHIYTGGWSSPVIPRDQGGTFDQMYTHRVMPQPLWQALEEQLEDWPELDEASRRLRTKEFTTMEEREELFETVLWESMKFSNTVWLMDLAGATPYRSEFGTAADVAGGIGDPAWVYSTHSHVDGTPVPGGTMRFAVPNLLVEPWNPVDGSAFTYDMLVNRVAMGGAGVLSDPRDGLYWPLRIEKAEVTVQEGLPVERAHDWLTLDFVEEIEVPMDAWADWDAEKQEWITVEERFGSEGTTSLMKVVTHYPADLYDFPLHDGSTISIGDFVAGMIVHFDRAKEASPIFDQAKVGIFESWLNNFRGVRIVSEDPLVIEHYSDIWYMDAEHNAYVGTWWPIVGTYDWTIFWHMFTVGMMAESDNALAFSTAKADDLGVDQMDYTKGPSLPILKERLDKAAADNYIPYEPVLGQYISEEEAAERWSNLQSFYADKGHFWVGSGPYMLKEVHAVEKIVVLERFPDYPEPADRWLFFLQDLE